MPTSIARHLRAYLGTGFWLTVGAATLNGVYWRVPADMAVQRVLAVGTGVVALAALRINLRDLQRGSVAGGRLGRRVTWLLVVTCVLVLGTVTSFLVRGV